MTRWFEMVRSALPGVFLILLLTISLSVESVGQSDGPPSDAGLDQNSSVFSGRVLQVAMEENISQPINGTDVELWCSKSAGVLGTFLKRVQTDSNGEFKLTANGSCDFFNILLPHPAVCGSSSIGGIVVNQSWISVPSSTGNQELSSNDFLICKMDCPDGCECLLQQEAKEKFNISEGRDCKKCSDEICGHSQAKEPKYCFKPVCTICQPTSSWSQSAESFLG
ncbi:MAG TPA: hypothetical protein PLI05_10950 [Methanotrichaceae archaeon]|nr:hypothetical protein [Methanotrichaceae archaeon]HQF17568.1 hypothetical protein [Methanotrichaceae archaeon]HQI92138.1 hypothetical protein [Methanotrichaceae archaeon]